MTLFPTKHWKEAQLFPETFEILIYFQRLRYQSHTDCLNIQIDLTSPYSFAFLDSAKLYKKYLQNKPTKFDQTFTNIWIIVQF